MRSLDQLPALVRLAGFFVALVAAALIAYAIAAALSTSEPAPPAPSHHAASAAPAPQATLPAKESLNVIH